MASLPRAQYKLPAACRNIIDLGDSYMFGGQLAKRDMSPIGFDRANPLRSPGPYNAFNLKGCGSAIFRDSAAYGIGTGNGLEFLSGSHFLFGMGAANKVFLSAAGVTLGQKFMVINDSICQILEGGEPLLKSTIPSMFWTTVQQADFIEHAEIIAENATTFYVYVRCSPGLVNVSGNTGSQSTQRVRLFTVDKSSYAWATYGVLSTTSSTSQNTSNIALANGTSDAFNSNKGYRYLTTLSDGRMVFSYYPFCYNGNMSQTQCVYRYFLFDPATGAFSASRFFNPTVTARYIYGIPTGLLARAPVGVEATGVYYCPETATDDTYTIRMFVLAANLPALVSGTGNNPEINSVICTVSGLPAGVTLLTPGSVSNVNAKGQISSWLMRDGGDDYLVCYGHNNGIIGRDTETYTPVNRHQMVIFKIDPTDVSKLTYVKHYNNAFDYGTVLSNFAASEDGKTLVVYNGSGFGILTWNSVSKNYTVSAYRGIPSGIMHLHLDTSGQIWIEDVDCKVYVFNLDLSATTEVTFVGNPSSLLYSGTTIEQEVDINAFSFAGARVARTIKLVTKGATFEDGTVQKTITSSATEAVRVKVFVNGAGNLSVDAFLL